MVKGYSGGSSAKSTGSGRTLRSAARSAGAVSSARLHQKSGLSNSFGGYAKVNHTNGTFSMRPTGK